MWCDSSGKNFDRLGILEFLSGQGVSIDFQINALRFAIKVEFGHSSYKY